MRLPCCSSPATPASHVFWTANTPQAPASALLREAASSRSPRTTSAPLPARARAVSPSGLRVMARTLWPPARRARATAPPWCPVAPVTRIVPVFIPPSRAAPDPTISRIARLRVVRWREGGSDDRLTNDESAAAAPGGVRPRGLGHRPRLHGHVLRLRPGRRVGVAARAAPVRRAGREIPRHRPDLRAVRQRAAARPVPARGAARGPGGGH